MKFVVLLVLFSCVSQMGLGKLIGYDNPTQELFLYRQKLSMLYNLLESKCPEYVRETQRREVELLPFHLTVVKQLYNKLIKSLAECENELSKGKMPVAITKTTTKTFPTTTTTVPLKYKDCQDAFEQGRQQSGVYEINLSTLAPFNVWCDFIGGKGYTVIQRRVSKRNISFDRDWSEYKHGFGDVISDYWLGNDKIHALTTTNRQLNIELILKDGSLKSGDWRKFYVSDEADNYRLTVEGAGLSGDTNHYFIRHNNMAFSTKDRDNDLVSSNCAADQAAGWWYNYCHQVNLNRESFKGMHWEGYEAPLRSSVMRVTR